MKKIIPICLALLALLGGCRTGRYELTEPLTDRAIEVKSGDRLSVVLDENPATGYKWMTECDDTNVTFARETLPPEGDPPKCSAARKVRIIIRVNLGFDGLAHVKLAYRRPWKGGGTAREINLMLHRKPEDNAPWK